MNGQANESWIFLWLASVLQSVISRASCAESHQNASKCQWINQLEAYAGYLFAKLRRHHWRMTMQCCGVVLFAFAFCLVSRSLTEARAINHHLSSFMIIFFLSSFPFKSTLSPSKAFHSIVSKPWESITTTMTMTMMALVEDGQAIIDAMI